MTNLQTSLQRACQELGLTIVLPFLLTAREGIQISAQALLPQLGAPRGVIVVNRHDDLCGIALELQRIGYGYSVLDEPLPSEDFDLESYVEMFSDWGWGNVNERKPDWMD
jgi:hypothetical protein